MGFGGYMDEILSWIAKIIDSPFWLSIITGIITFIITWPVSNWLAKRTNKQEYQNRIEKCNEEIIHTCEDYVIMAREVTDEVFGNIIKGACIEYNVDTEKAYSILNVKAVLTKNFVSMRLIPDADKKDIIDKLCKVSENPLNNNEQHEVVVEKLIFSKNEREVKLITTSMAVMTSCLGIIVTLLSTMGAKTYDLRGILLSETKDLSSIALAIILAVVCELIVAMGIMKRRRRRIKKRRKPTHRRHLR